MYAAIDFGISNTDAVASIDGSVRHWTRPSDGSPDAEIVRQVLAAGGVELPGRDDPSLAERAADTIARHGGRLLSRDPEQVTALFGVDEVTAIGRGGQALALAEGDDPETPILVVSAGSGTAVVVARGSHYAHITGSGVGGGTLLGLGRLLLDSADAPTIDALAQQGDPNGADLSLKDVISGPIGTLPPDATAVNFGKLARSAQDVSRPDLAAALMTLVGQVIAITAINAARAERLQRIVVIGHMTDMPSFRTVLNRVGDYYGTRLMLPSDAGYGTALGAMLHRSTGAAAN